MFTVWQSQKINSPRVVIERTMYDVIVSNRIKGRLLNSGKKYHKDIQVFRGIAVLAVVLFHAKENYFPSGFLGVDVFFVISGFVISPLILRVFSSKDISGWRRLSKLRYFYEQRFYRLAPALATTLVVSLIVIFLLGPIADLNRFAKQGISTLLLSGNLGAYRYSEDYFSPNPNPLVHTWSLSVEEQIYLFMPIIIMLILYNRRSTKKIIVVVLAFITAISFILFLFPIILQPVYSWVGIQRVSQFSFYSPIDRIWQFNLGGLGFFLLERYQPRLRKFPISIDLILVISVLIILFGPIHIGSKLSSILASLIAVIVILLKSLEVLPNFLIQKLAWLGDRSYSIYLVHMPLIYLAKYSPMLQIRGTENRIIQSAIAVVVSILLGAASYSKIENRFRYIGKSSVSSFKTLSTGMILSVIVPLTLFLALDWGNKNRYWGLDKNLPMPVSAWELDPKCNRMSKLIQPCMYKVLEPRSSVLLIGDSHAAHISQAVIDAGKNVQWNVGVWTQAGCPVQIQQSSKNQVSDQCLKQNQEILKWTEENKPDAIIVSQFVYSNSSQAHLRKSLSALHSIIPNILLIENNPIFPDGKNFMAQRSLMMSPYSPPKSFKQLEMEIQDRTASDQLANWARNNGISTLNFESLFCKKEVCTRFSNSKWLYRDADHFSVAGAELTIPQLISFFKGFL